MKDPSYCKINNANTLKNGKLQGPHDGEKWKTMRPLAKSILLLHPNRTAATESWLIISVQAYPAFPDFLIFPRMIQFRGLCKIS